MSLSVWSHGPSRGAWSRVHLGVTGPMGSGFGGLFTRGLVQGGVWCQEGLVLGGGLVPVGMAQPPFVTNTCKNTDLLLASSFAGDNNEATIA